MNAAVKTKAKALARRHTPRPIEPCGHLAIDSYHGVCLGCIVEEFREVTADLTEILKEECAACTVKKLCAAHTYLKKDS